MNEDGQPVKKATAELRKAGGTVAEAMKLQTRVFEFYKGNYSNLCNLAQTMGLSVSQVYRIRQGRRSVNEKFIIGAIKAFPGYKLDDLFYVAPDGSQND